MLKNFGKTNNYSKSVTGCKTSSCVTCSAGLKLNHERYEEEVKAGMHDRKAPAGGEKGPKGGKKATKGSDGQLGLF